jgi:hypothetical protein
MFIFVLRSVCDIFDRTSSLPCLPRILIFNQQSERRGGEGLLKELFDTLIKDGIQIDYALFTTNQVGEPGTVIEGMVLDKFTLV